MLPKKCLKALGHKGFKIGSSWGGYQNATSGTFHREKCRFFAPFPSFSQAFSPCKRCDTELAREKRAENFWIWEKIPANAPDSGSKSKKEEFQ